MREHTTSCRCLYALHEPAQPASVSRDRQFAELSGIFGCIQLPGGLLHESIEQVRSVVKRSVGVSFLCFAFSVPSKRSRSWVWVSAHRHVQEEAYLVCDLCQLVFDLLAYWLFTSIGSLNCLSVWTRDLSPFVGQFADAFVEGTELEGGHVANSIAVLVKIIERLLEKILADNPHTFVSDCSQDQARRRMFVRFV